MADDDIRDSLVQVSFIVIGLLTRAAADHDLSLTQLRMLAILRDREPTMAELATYLGLERSSVSGLIDRAVTRGLVRRDTADHDGRSVRVSLTAAGQKLAPSVEGQIDASVAPLMSRLTAADRKRLGSLLARMLG